jgi:hypothetical protein
MMRLGEVLRGVAATYSRVTGGEGQAILERATKELDPSAVPVGWLVRPSRRIGQFTHTPWLGFFNPDETTDPKVGVYVCWIFEPDLQHVVISIQQGTESLAKNLRGEATVPAQLRSDAETLRNALAPTLLHGLLEPISFGTGARQVRYAAGSVAQLRFNINRLPPESELLNIHQRFCDLLAEVIAARASTLQRTPGALSQSVPLAAQAPDGVLELFKPKSVEDYLVHLAANTARRQRRHEKVVNAYSSWAVGHGWAVASPHPVDLRLRRGQVAREGSPAWTNAIMFEAKVIRRGNATQAVREVIGQLATYPYLVVPEEARATIKTAGLFSESIGDLWLNVLERNLGIATVWWEGGRWNGGSRAQSLGLVE